MIRIYTYFALTGEIKNLFWKGKRESQARVKKKMNPTENAKKSKRNLQKEAITVLESFRVKNTKHTHKDQFCSWLLCLLIMFSGLRVKCQLQGNDSVVSYYVWFYFLQFHLPKVGRGLRY